MSFVHRIPDKRDTVTYFAFCFPFSYEECQTMLDKYDEQFKYCYDLDKDKCDPDAIYYHRELLCHSLDKKRIDLITISGCNQITLKREPCFDPDNLFPDNKARKSKRCYRFDKKRVFILTSRVHPGETPASFVFNGFLEFILRKDDPRAKALRRIFVFKLIPMLNPDGVVRGHYRTDQLGVNLNRVYLDPSFRLSPSIYACKSLIVYHHINNRISKEHDGLNFDHVFKLEYDSDDLIEELKADNSSSSNNGSSNQSEQILTDEPTMYFKNCNLKNIIATSSTSRSSSSTSSASSIIINSARLNSNRVLPRKTSMINSARSTIKNEDNAYNLDDFTNLKTTQKSKSFVNPSEQPAKKSNFGYRSLDVTKLLKDIISSDSSYFKPRNEPKEEPKNERKKSNDLNSSQSSLKAKSLEQDDETTDKHIGNENSDEEDASEFLTSNNGLPNSAHLNDPKLALINPLWSGIAFYVDLHGHAAKRGCFIYGNSIENELYQVENVLFTKLIAFNSQHFDFDGCNFSVKNMYMKDKREGLSKEGSGRVAMFKKLGIIHSYTLECCYASGKVMNSIAPAINTNNGYNMGNRWSLANPCPISPPLHTDLPPKFMPEHYADVGKALAIAALDIIEMNPYTRIPNTSFGSLEAVRNWVKFFIRSKNGGGIVNNGNNANTNVVLSSLVTNQALPSQNGASNPANSTNNTSSNNLNSLAKKSTSNIRAQQQKYNKIGSKVNSNLDTANKALTKNQESSLLKPGNPNSLSRSSVSALNNNTNNTNKPINLAKNNSNVPKNVQKQATSTNLNARKSAVANSQEATSKVGSANHRNLAQRHSVGVIPTETEIQIGKTNNKATTPPLIRPYKTNFGLINNNLTATSQSSPQPMNGVNSIRFNSGQSKFRANLKKMKELEIPTVESAPSLLKSTQSGLLQPVVQNPKNSKSLDSENKTNDPYWYLDENELQKNEDESKKSSKRKLLPINKANISGAANANQNNSSNVIFFNKLNSNAASRKGSKVSETINGAISNKPSNILLNINIDNNKASLNLEASESLVLNSSRRKVASLDRKSSNKSVNDELIQKNSTSSNGSDSNPNDGLEKPKEFEVKSPTFNRHALKQKSINFLRKTQSVLYINEPRKN